MVRNALLFTLTICVCWASASAEMMVGFGEADITPDVKGARPVWLAGYGAQRFKKVGIDRFPDDGTALNFNKIRIPIVFGYFHIEIIQAMTNQQTNPAMLYLFRRHKRNTDGCLCRQRQVRFQGGNNLVTMAKGGAAVRSQIELQRLRFN